MNEKCFWSDRPIHAVEHLEATCLYQLNTLVNFWYFETIFGTFSRYLGAFCCILKGTFLKKGQELIIF